jgi:hypothetical protein
VAGRRNLPPARRAVLTFIIFTLAAAVAIPENADATRGSRPPLFPRVRRTDTTGITIARTAPARERTAMPQIFHRAYNTLSLVTIYGSVFFLALVGWILYTLARSPVATNVGVTREQPVPFSHAHHVAELGIDCRYCHTSVEDSHFAGIPPTKTCMNCHSQIWQGGDMLGPVRESYKSGKAIEWNRVHRINDFCYFNHSVHVKKGIGCASCHGRVDQMQLMYQDKTLLMEWCVDCHRAPEKHVRPRDQVYNMAFRPQDAKHPETGEPFKDQEELGAYYAEKYQLRNKISCNACHR